MTNEQKSIIALFNTKELCDIEIAQECALSTGNGKWFNRYINKLISSVVSRLKEYDTRGICINYCGKDCGEIIIPEKDEFNFLANALIFWGCYMEVFPNRGEDSGYEYISTIIKNDSDDYIEINFDWSGFGLVEKLRAESIVFDIFYH